MTSPAGDSPSTTGLPSNIVAVLAYLFGCIGGIVLLLIERRDGYVRFHAMQSTLTFLIILVAALIAGSVPVAGWLFSGLLSFAAGILWLVLMFKAFTGQRYKLPYIGEMAERQIR